MRKGFFREHFLLISFFQRLVDVLAVITSGILSYHVTFTWQQDIDSPYISAIAITAIVTNFVFLNFDLYRTWRGTTKSHEFQVLLSSWVTVFVLLSFIGFITKTSMLYSRYWIGSWIASGAVMLILVRLFRRMVLSYFRKKGYNQRHIVIVGDGQLGQDVYNHVQSLPDLGFNVCGYFCFDQSDIRTKNETTYIANVDELSDFITTKSVDQLWIALPINKEKEIQKILYDLRNSLVDIRLVPNLFGFKLLTQSMSSIAGMPLVNLAVSPMNGVNRIVKFFEDRVFAFFILSLISPIMLFIAIGVKLSSPGPILYRQKRLSWNGKPFFMYKFRTMPVDAESQTGAVWANPTDNRATAFGAFLRRTSLDELPQFFNVLKGEMSIVGPRPERPVFVNKFKEKIPGYMHKHKVKAGITGWAQVNGWRGNTDLTKRIEHDLYYIENWSLWFDIKIILLTFLKGFINKNAY